MKIYLKLLISYFQLVEETYIENEKLKTENQKLRDEIRPNDLLLIIYNVHIIHLTFRR